MDATTSLYYDRQGQPITRKKWEELMEDHEHYVVVKHTRFYFSENEEEQPLVSTVWLGIDSRSWIKPEGPPIVFETMILGGSLHGYQERYATEEEALVGHEKVVKLVLETLGIDKGEQ